MRRLLLERLKVRDLRNLQEVDLEPAPRVNVVTGNNGHGKTSLLEAVYFAATSRSFRTARLAELCRHGAAQAVVKARFTEVGTGEPGDLPPLSRDQVASFGGKSVTVRIDGNAPRSLSEFATRSPVIAFHPEELTLSTGAAAGRRTLLDRVALFLDPRSADHRARYARALKARQQLLRDAAPGAYESGEIEAFEALAAQHGAALTQARAEAAELLAAELGPAFSQIAAPDLSLAARYEPGGSADPEAAAAELRARRPRDAHRPSAGFGPHRDDLGLSFDGHPARVVGSQGQHRALTLALKAAEAAAIARARGLLPILLLDDVSSELDGERTEALFAFLGLAQGQIFLTTTRRELIVTPGVDPADRRDFRMESGRLSPLG
ncbi:MAG: DNA replication and repair protein RecF [Byssovorax sp.]